MSDEVALFKTEIAKPHRRVNPCFMTGKGCVYTEQIDREIELRKAKKLSAGFMILPFQPNLSVVYDLSLKRFICGTYGSSDAPVELTRADQVRKTGYIICEKICKKIQESDFVLADISVPNPNVFYELGLAYGIGQKIFVVHHDKSLFGAAIARWLGCKAYAYADLNPLKVNEFQLSGFLWEREPAGQTDDAKPGTFLLDDLDLPGFIGAPQAAPDGAGRRPAPPPKDITLSFPIHVSDAAGVAIDNIRASIEHSDQSTPAPKDIGLSFPVHVSAAVGVAIDNILAAIKQADQSISIPVTYHTLIDGLKTTELIPRNAGFRAILDRMDGCFCSIIRTGGATGNPLMYFWLGYCHARGKNVIPIAIEVPDKGIDDLAFDIRALWHMSFVWDKPYLLEKEIEETLYQMILSDFSEWSRRRFWDELLEKRGKVSIFTGALFNPKIGREMIGDWDLRAASELTSYFAGHQYRATIESPVYEFRQVVQRQGAVQKGEYLTELEELLRGKNCVIIASPDVNPLTELVLGKIYGVNRENWFDSDFPIEALPNTVVAFKTRNSAADVDEEENGKTFYRERAQGDQGMLRGFRSSILENREVSGRFVSQTEGPQESTVHAHLVIVPNPYREEEQQEDKYIVLLNGVSGPATFALTHVLTGGVSREFVSYEPGFDPNLESEKTLKDILEDFSDLRKARQPTGIQYILSVTVGRRQEPEGPLRSASHEIFDWRRIRRWQLLNTTHEFLLKC